MLVGGDPQAVQPVGRRGRERGAHGPEYGWPKVAGDVAFPVAAPA